MIGGSKLEIQREKLSPMMQHYLATKEKYPDCILFYRLGDFYEMFFDDAIKVSRELELTWTGRDGGLPERAPIRLPFVTSCQIRHPVSWWNGMSFELSHPVR